MNSDDIFIFDQQLLTKRCFKTGMTKANADDLVVRSD